MLIQIMSTAAPETFACKSKTAFSMSIRTAYIVNSYCPLFKFMEYYYLVPL